MGGANQFNESNLRIHESGGDVHVHDDAKSVRFKMSVGDWKTKYAQLKADTVASGVGILFDDTGHELRATKISGKVSFALHEVKSGFERFDDFVATL